MRLPEVCIERPVLTTVMSLAIVLIGAIALLRLPNRELPDVDPPVVAGNASSTPPYSPALYDGIGRSFRVGIRARF